MIGTIGERERERERESGKSIPAAWFDDNLTLINSIYQVFPSNTNNLHTAAWFQILMITLGNSSNSLIWLIDGTLTQILPL